MTGRLARKVGEALERGAAHHREGRWAEAAGAYAEVLSLDPDHVDALALLAGALLRLGRPEPALAAATRATTRDPAHALAWLSKGRALATLERPEEAIVAFDRALVARPGFGEAALGRARACVAAGRAVEALPVLRAAAERDPRARWELGMAQVATRDLEAAAASWDEAARHGVGDPAERRRLWVRLGAEKLRAGDPAALAWLRRAAEAGEPGGWATLADAVLLLRTADEETLRAILAREDVDAQRVEPVVRARPEAGHRDDPLLAGWLTRTIVAAADAIGRLRAVRDELANEAARGEDPDPALLSAFATQAWYTGGAWGGEPPSLPDTPVGRAAAAMYIGTAPTGPEPPVASLGDPADPTSLAVREQYETHPYPRLVGAHIRAPIGLAAYVRGASGLTWAPRPEPRVLVAGGGTGRHPLAVASAVGCEVVCIDLSRRSLQIAAALAERHDAPVRFLQGDLLDLGGADALGTFDLVDCVGVLHHLADPARGLRALVARLAPGGLVRLGLYSERARADVVAARALVADLVPDDAGLHAARARLLALPATDPAAPVTRSVDFWTQPGLRDLVFHPCEHRYSPTGVAALVRGAGLRIRALQHVGPEARDRYAARWPDDAEQVDMTRWEGLEAEWPRMFAGMIHVWCDVASAGAGT